jgi:hypothetical protein
MAMNDLVSLFRNFIYRDLAFILGGSIVILSILYSLQSCIGANFYSPLNQAYMPYILFLFTVLAYVVGYTVQDFLALVPCRLTFTGYVFQPGCLSQCLYRRFTDHEWKPLSSFANLEAMHEFGISMHKFKIPKATLRDLERIRSLKVFSMCIGGCCGPKILAARPRAPPGLVGALSAHLYLFPFIRPDASHGWPPSHPSQS